MEQKKAEEITEEFFKRRFPDKEIAFEKTCGYFWTWVERFKTGYPEGSMDEISKKVWREMQASAEADEISQEDLEAAAEMHDRVLSE